MKETTQKIMEQIEKNHDWEEGQVYGGGGTVMRSTSTCRICLLEEKWYSDKQNGVDSETTYYRQGERIPLRAALQCDI